MERNMALSQLDNTNIDEQAEHILVGLSASPSNAKILQTAAKMATAFKGSFTALYVKTPESDSMTEADKERLQKNIHIAEQLGATVTTIYGDNIPFQIAEYARLSDVTKIVIGRSAAGRKSLFRKTTLTEQLVSIAPNTEVFIIPDGTVKISEQYGRVFKKKTFLHASKDLLISLLVLAVASAFGYLFSRLGFTEANIVTVYILGVLVTAIITSSKICWVFSAVASVLVFNFLFTVPKFSLLAYDKGYPITFVIMLAASLFTGSITGKIKNQSILVSQAAYRTKILFDTNLLIQHAKSDKEIIDITTEQINKLLKRESVVYLPDDKERYFNVPETGMNAVTDDTKEIVRWVAKNNKKAGTGTENYANDIYLYLPISVKERNFGVISILIDDHPIDSFENSILQSIIGECALALDSRFNAKQKELSAVIAKNEQLRANLLRAISHDLRTPLTAISGNASNLISSSNAFDEETKQNIYSDIYDDSMWLINVVENLLSVTRIEEGKMNIAHSAELIDEVIDEALKHVSAKKNEHNITVINKDDLLLAKIDGRLIVQVIINIVNNAIKYTPVYSEITITTQKCDNQVVVSIVDNGGGIPDNIKPFIFDMFFTGATQVADSRRSLGLGLFLCKAIIAAHGGEITLTDNFPHGAVFTFTLPIEEIKTDE
jgi:Osmosensitive K+ channel histidine kinase